MDTTGAVAILSCEGRVTSLALTAHIMQVFTGWPQVGPRGLVAQIWVVGLLHPGLSLGTGRVCPVVTTVDNLPLLRQDGHTPSLTDTIIRLPSLLAPVALQHIWHIQTSINSLSKPRRIAPKSRPH